MIMIYLVPILIFIWILIELIVRWVAQKGINTGFYGSINKDEVRKYQEKFGVKIFTGQGWVHLGWIADPERERYQIKHLDESGNWRTLGEAKFGSWLGENVSGTVKVIAVDKNSGERRVVGRVALPSQTAGKNKISYSIPRIAGQWHTLFKPEKSGNYINDHCIYQDRDGKWRLLGITSQSDGDYRKERCFAAAKGDKFPPEELFAEEAPVADFGELAWAPDVITDKGKYHLFWSPHQLHHMTSNDGTQWKTPEVVIEKPFHKFFRDAKIFKNAPDQWLLYATGRGRWFSRIDIYQSFDLIHWQYIRPAIRCGWGSEKNFVTGSMESPFLIKYQGNYYLSLTYNNESFFLSALLLQFGKFLNKKDYNNTLIFRSTNPYDFGVYRGRSHTPALITRLRTHAPVYIQIEGQWYLTTCGWPFAATITRGEVNWAKLEWDGES
jgi:hypothetical protein